MELPATTALLALIHGVAVVDGQVVLNAGAFAFTTVLGFVLGWVRTRSGSVWPSVVLHNTWKCAWAAVKEAERVARAHGSEPIRKVARSGLLRRAPRHHRPDLWCRGAPLDGCLPCPSPILRSSATMSWRSPAGVSRGCC